MTPIEVAAAVEAASDHLSSAAIRLANAANALHVAAAGPTYSDFIAAVESFKRVLRQTNDAMTSVNDCDFNLWKVS